MRERRKQTAARGEMMSAFAGHQKQRANKTAAQAVSAAIPVPIGNSGIQAALERQTRGQLLPTDRDAFAEMVPMR